MFATAMDAKKKSGDPNLAAERAADRESCPPKPDDGFADLKRVMARTSLSRSTIYREMASGRFPRPHKLSLGRVGWLCSEIEVWMAARAAGGQP